MAMQRSSANAAFLPDEAGQLVVRPAALASRAILATTAVYPNGGLRVPVVADDANAAWTPELTEIALSDVDLDESAADYKALKGLTKISNELADDSSPEAAEIVGRSIARDIAKQIDNAYFVAGGSTVNAPSGVDAAGLGVKPIAGSTADLDWAEEASIEAEDEGATIKAFVVNKATAKQIMALRESSGSNRGLLQSDPGQPGRRVLAGSPLLISPAVEDNVVWALPGDGLALVAIRKDVEMAVDRSVFFTSDAVAVRTVTRVDFLFPHPAAIAKVTLTV